ncbi:MAG: glycosyltransferase [Acidobacteria bacterium]|nr:glycosyltransferase [Acidobacteriota bacterium]MSO61981.1 glycosyltransferase [Acidobacteriota bacterium]
MAATPSLSVFFPAYNDAGTIASLVISAVQVAATLTPDYEVIVINDGSQDDTPRRHHFPRSCRREHLRTGPRP